MSEYYYLGRKNRLLKGWDKNLKHLIKALKVQFNSDFPRKVIPEIRSEFENLIAQMPFAGGKNPSTLYLIESSFALALYKVLKRHGKTTEEAGKVLYDAVKARTSSYPKFVLFFFHLYMTSSFFKKKQRSLCLQSQKRLFPDDWVSYLPFDLESMPAIIIYLYSRERKSRKPFLIRSNS